MEMKTRSESKISLSRTTRAKATHPPKSDRCPVSKSLLPGIPESPKDVTRTRPQVSPSVKAKRKQDDSKPSKNSIVTPKSKRPFEVLDDRTPLKDEVLFCSQQFDSQSGIGWDSHASSSVRYVRLNKGRHKNTDVTDIVMKLVVPEDERHHDDNSLGTPPMLGIWMDSGASHNQDTDQPHTNTRSGRRKAKMKILNESGSMNEMMEKLKLAIENFREDDPSRTRSEKDNPPTSNKDSGKTLADMDGSTDLFSSVDKQVLQSDIVKITASVSRRSSPRLGNKPENKSLQKSSSNESDTSWSDDELFQEDSFIIKATQNPLAVIGIVREQSNKRKSESDNPDQPANKNAKIEVKQCYNATSLNCGKQGCNVNSAVTTSQSKDVVKVDDITMSSPFRRHSSFESIHSKMDNSKQDTSNKLRFRKTNSFSGPLSTSTPAKLMFQATDSSTAKIMSPIMENTSNIKSSYMNNVKDNQTVNKPSNGQRWHTKSTNSTQRMTQMCQAFPIMGKSMTNVNTNVKNNYSDKQSHGCVKPTNSTHQMTRVSQTQLKPLAIFPCRNNNASLSNKSKTQVVANRNTASVSNRNNASKTSMAENRSTEHFKSTSTSRFGKQTESKTSNNKFNKQVVKSESPVNSSRRRSSGIFDSSLTDDLLCQLAEPDDILESQASPEVLKSSGSPVCDRNKTAAKDLVSSDSTKYADKGKCNEGGVSNSVVVVNKDIPQDTQIVQTNKIASSQVGKYKFKHKLTQSRNSSSSSLNKLSAVVEDSGSKSDAKSRETKVVGPQNKKAMVVMADSEDLFMSDDDVDALSEPQILAMLETVELQATQMSEKEETSEQTNTVKQKAAITEAQKSTNEQKISSSPLSSQSDISDSPIKCTPEDIERKKNEALQRRRQISGGNLPLDNQIPSSPSNSQSNTSPFKRTPEEIEKKRQEAIRKRQASGSINSNGVVSSPNYSDNSESPFKCSPEEIERKKRAALAKRKVLAGPGNQCVNSVTGNSVATSDSADKKQILEEIERKKQAALKRRQERLKATQMLASQKPGYNCVNR